MIDLEVGCAKYPLAGQLTVVVLLIRRQNRLLGFMTGPISEDCDSYIARIELAH
jgi:hypothetical protein